VKVKFLVPIGIALSVSAFAQSNPQSTVVVESTNPTPIFRVIVVSRTFKRSIMTSQRKLKAGLRGHGLDAIGEW
jgi:hypothetical protein